ncbi:hypothetical protein ABVT39_022406 [Epinephelus coioides]
MAADAIGSISCLVTPIRCQTSIWLCPPMFCQTSRRPCLMKSCPNNESAIPTNIQPGLPELQVTASINGQH